MSGFIELAFVGAGKISWDHARAIKSIPQARVVSVMDPDPAVAHELAQYLGGAHVTNHLSDLPATVQGAVVCSPTAVHAAQVRELLTRGIGVLVEKPFVSQFDEAEPLFKLATSMAVPLVAAQVLRHLPVFDVLTQAVSSGDFGQPLQVIERRLVDRSENYPWWKDLPAFLISHWGAHSVDLVCHVMQDQAIRVACEADSVRSAFGVIDDFNMLARFSSGLRMVSSMSFSSRQTMHDLLFIGSEQTIMVDCYRSVTVNGSLVYEEDEGAVLAEGFKRQMQNFIHSLNGSKKMSQIDSSVLRSLRTLQAAETAALARDGRSVTVQH